MIYVTGLSGLIGKAFHRVCPDNLVTVDPRNGTTTWLQGDSPPCLVHLGWRSIPSSSSSTKNQDDCLLDIKHSKQLIDSFLSSNPKGKIVFLSSSGAMYAPAPEKFLDEDAQVLPTSLYGEAKLIVERYITSATDNAIILRCSNAWGGKIVENRRNGFIDRLIYNSRMGIPVTISIDRQSVLSIVHVKDIALSILKGIKKLDSYSHKVEIYNISAEALSIDSIVRRISAVSPIKENYLGGIANFTKVSSSKACHVLKWSPRHLLNSLNIRAALNAYK